MENEKTMDKILFVDDHEAICRAYARAFRTESFQVECAYSAAEAIQKIQLDNYVLVLTDKDMEEHGIGLKVIEAAKTAKPLRPVILCSGDLSESDIAKAKEYGADKIYHKPVEMSELKLEIIDLIEKYKQGI